MLTTNLESPNENYLFNKMSKLGKTNYFFRKELFLRYA